MELLMDEILAKANELGLLIKETEAYIQFEYISNDVEKNNEASVLLKKYNEIAETIQQKQSAGFELEKFEQERFRELSETVVSNELLMEYLKKRDIYIDLLTQIYNALSNQGS
jgi:cell fate (sporulation/competence/biofilm development) regulator YlbF (YheA/YmcA/DUF963 family)